MIAIKSLALQTFPTARIALTVEHSDISGEVTEQADFDGEPYDLKSFENMPNTFDV